MAFNQYTPEDFVAKLKTHLLSRLRESIRQERTAHEDDGPEDTSMADFTLDRHEYEQVIIRKDLMYKHKLAKFNYTTYDVRRAQDVINPGTSRCNVMVLSNAKDEENPNADRFAYARVIGVYHVNAILAGHDYRLRRLEFLWVRWYKNSAAFRWDSFKLEQVQFPPMADDDAFGFIDPRDVVRACHLVPRISTGQVHRDGIGLSKLAKDYHDWRSYFINWYPISNDALNMKTYSDDISFVDRDMIIRNLPSLGVGHVYSPSVATGTHTADGTLAQDIPEDIPEDIDIVMARESQAIGETQHEGDSLEVDDPEFGLENREIDILDEEDVSGEEGDLQLSDEDIIMDALEDSMDDCCE